jgi:RNA polymerase sigma factor (sigma-70 family)
MKDRKKVMDDVADVASHEDWRSFFSKFAPGLLLFVRQWTQSRADAEDIVQEAFVKFWRRNHRIDPPALRSGAASNRALLYATVRSIALDHIRRNRRRVRREAEAVSESEHMAEPQFKLADEAQLSLAAAVERLRHEQREVLIMKIWNELTFAEIGSALGISQNTAASRYRYGLAALRKVFQPQ